MSYHFLKIAINFQKCIPIIYFGNSDTKTTKLDTAAEQNPENADDDITFFSSQKNESNIPE
jgi:hypothetical protein